MSKLLKQYMLGDMIARYIIDDNNEQVGLVLVPADETASLAADKIMQVDSLIQLKLTGDIYDEAYAQGISMRNGETVRRLYYHGQEVQWEGDCLVVTTIMKDRRGYLAKHILSWKKDMPYVRIHCSFQNNSEESVTLEMFESFSLSEISPYLSGDGYEQLELYRIRSVWSQEGRLDIVPLEDLQLEPAWAPHAVRCEKFGQVGSMPVNKYFPFVAVKDKQNDIFWGAQIAHPASWQIELYRKDDGLSLSGGLADRDFGHWNKNIKQGEIFTTPTAIISVAKTASIDIFSARLTIAGEEGLQTAPVIEDNLPIVFNEYCTTWGCPSHKNILDILKAIDGKGFTYFVIDCGWFKETGVPWDISMGDYNVSEDLFPEGLHKTVDAIKEKGMIPGIWFEIENVGSAAKAYHLEEHLLKKDGKVLTSYFRRFWDMRDPWVQDYLTKKVIGTLQKYGFGYMKIDYNETIGIGCDGAESLGEGLRQNMDAAVEFIEKVKREVPGIVLENCASGGHRLEPRLMGLSSMASFSDAHECVEIPIIAANLHRVTLPRQNQIWAVIRKEDSLQRIAYSVTSTFLGRMCISGDVTELDPLQWQVITAGMEFYRSIASIIKTGQSFQYGSRIKSIRHPQGWQALLRVGKDQQAIAVIHTFGGELPDRIEFDLPEGCPDNIVQVYSYTEEDVIISDNKIIYKPKANFVGIAILFNQV